LHIEYNGKYANMGYKAKKIKASILLASTNHNGKLQIHLTSKNVFQQMGHCS